VNDQAKAVEFDFVNPIRLVGTLVPRVGMAGRNCMTGNIGG